VTDVIHDDSLSFVDRKSFKGVVGSGPLLGHGSLRVMLVNYGRVIYSIYTLTFYKVKDPPGEERYVMFFMV
jgi:hypothetical protein